MAQDQIISAAHPVSSARSWKMTLASRYPELGPRIVLVSGGSGARELSQHLIRFTYRSSHLIPMFDDGGSSRHIRNHFHIPPPGDLRNRMVALSDSSEGGHPAVQKLFTTRLAQEGESPALHQELTQFVQGNHPLMHAMEKRFKQLICSYLQVFYEHLPKSFDLRGGNLGNFIITGGLLLHQNFDTVLYILQELVKVRGRIIPICEGNYFLRAVLNDQSFLDGQQRITREEHFPIQEIRYLEYLDSVPKELIPEASSSAFSVLRKGDLLVYTMGSLFTSLLPVLGVKGIAEAIRKAPIPKVLILNATEDPETRNFNGPEILRHFYRTLTGKDDFKQLSEYVHYIICDSRSSHLPGRIPVQPELLKEMGLQVFDGPYLDEQNHYIPEKLLRLLFAVL
ncbi:MAG: gluconeogenesis factor YvcK family protein [Planctomycetota bacterium]